jgi:hypothetical protein
MAVPLMHFAALPALPPPGVARVEQPHTATYPRHVVAMPRIAVP